MLKNIFFIFGTEYWKFKFILKKYVTQIEEGVEKKLSSLLSNYINSIISDVCQRKASLIDCSIILSLMGFPYQWCSRIQQELWSLHECILSLKMDLLVGETHGSLNANLLRCIWGVWSFSHETWMLKVGVNKS